VDVATRPVALITGGSRGIGAATALALAARNYDVTITYHNKAARADEVVQAMTPYRVRARAIQCDITIQEDIDRLFTAMKEWTEHIDLLVLNASGGLERKLVATDPDYPMHINRDAQVATLNSSLPCMPTGSTIIFVTSHWAHLYGKVQDLPAYSTIAESKYAGEQALRLQQHELTERGIRLIVVTGDLIEGTITPKLLERAAPGMTKDRQQSVGQLPTATDMGEAIALAATDMTLTSGSTVVIGGALESLSPLVPEQSTHLF
jgi:NAD(P)-dependent dehydrogenase (short-subunit alcohol dehydrogenase family)